MTQNIFRVFEILNNKLFRYGLFGHGTSLLGGLNEFDDDTVWG
jgi:hypothetical protein